MLSIWQQVVQFSCQLPQTTWKTVLEDTGRKRRRCSKDGSGQPTAFPVKSYASATGFDISKMPEAEKLDFLIEQVCVTPQLAIKIHMKTKLDNAYHKIVKMLEEARSRCNNLIFTNIPEPDSETNHECLQPLRGFFKKQLKLPSNEGEDFVLQRVHWLGRKHTRDTTNGEMWRPQPIIAGFHDFCDWETVLGNSKHHIGRAFGIHQDFPVEIAQPEENFVTTTVRRGQHKKGQSLCTQRN